VSSEQKDKTDGYSKIVLAFDDCSGIEEIGVQIIRPNSKAYRVMDCVFGSSSNCPRKMIHVSSQESAADWKWPSYPGPTQEPLDEDGLLSMSHGIEDWPDKIAQNVALAPRVQYVRGANISNV